MSLDVLRRLDRLSAEESLRMVPSMFQEPAHDQRNRRLLQIDGRSKSAIAQILP